MLTTEDEIIKILSPVQVPDFWNTFTQVGLACVNHLIGDFKK